MNLDELQNDAIRAAVRHHAARQGLSLSERTASGGGFQAVLTREEGSGDVFFATAPLGAAYLSLSLVLVVDEVFFRENATAILEVLSEYEVSAGLAKDGALKDEEVYLNLSLRLFHAGLNAEVFGLAIANLAAARDALAETFP